MWSNTIPLFVLVSSLYKALGRYVQVSQETAGFINLAEIEAFAPNMVLIAPESAAQSTTYNKYFLVGLDTVCSALGAFSVGSSDECQQYASAYLGIPFKQITTNENEPKGCFHRPSDGDIFWNKGGTDGAGNNRQIVCKGGGSFCFPLLQRFPLSWNLVRISTYIPLPT